MVSEQKKQSGREVYEWLQTLVCSVLAVVLVFTFAVRGFQVDGQSMRETLQDGDMLLILNDHLCGGYQPGNIVVLRKASFRDGKPLVKRVIATEGQTVDIDFEAGIVYVDGLPLEEPYISTPTQLKEGAQFPQIVEEGCVFVMGDNRMNSRDSRYPRIGQIDTREVLGKVLCLIFPGTGIGGTERDFGRIGAIG